MMLDIFKMLEPLMANEQFLEGLRNLLRECGGDILGFEGAILRFRNKNTEVPNVLLIDQIVIYDGKMLDLSHSPRALQVFRCFMKSPTGFVTRQQLADDLYGELFPRVVSKRLNTSRLNSSVKMVGRARQIARERLSSMIDLGGDWFFYDAKNKGWHLYYVSQSRLVRKKSSVDTSMQH